MKKLFRVLWPSAVMLLLTVACASAQTIQPIDTDDGTITGAKVAPVVINLSYLWNGSTWARATIDAYGSQKFTLMTAAGAAATLSTDVVEDAPETNAETGPKVMSTRRDTPVSSASTSGDNATFNTDQNGLQWTRTNDPCTALPTTTDPFSVTTDTVIISALSAKKNYICAIAIVAGAAEIVDITEGTGSVCGTSEAALLGSTTDANGASFGANGGLAIGNGAGAVIKGKTTNVDTCLNVSGSNRVSGFVTYVQAP